MVSNLLEIIPEFSGRTRLASSCNSGCCLLSTDCVKNCCKHFICNNSFNFYYSLILAREEITVQSPSVLDHSFVIYYMSEKWQVLC